MLDHVLDAVDDEEVALVVVVAQIARLQPSVLVEQLSGRLRGFPIWCIAYAMKDLNTLRNVRQYCCTAVLQNASRIKY